LLGLKIILLERVVENLLICFLFGKFAFQINKIFLAFGKIENFVLEKLLG